jgi:hypothetical protein
MKHRGDAALKFHGLLLLARGAAGVFVEMTLPLDIAVAKAICPTTNLAQAVFEQRFQI